MKKESFLIFAAIISFHTVSSQQRTLQLGGKLINDLTLYDGYAPGLGGQLVYRIKKHGGLETGIYYKLHRTESIFYTINSAYVADVSEKRILVPILYRYDSKIINFNTGVIMEYFVGWKQTSGESNIKITSYHNDSRFGGSAGISKTINVIPGYILEPEIHFYYVFDQEDGGVCFNISFRKIIF